MTPNNYIKIVDDSNRVIDVVAFDDTSEIELRNALAVADAIRGIQHHCHLVMWCMPDVGRELLSTMLFSRQCFPTAHRWETITKQNKQTGKITKSTSCAACGLNG